jgi:opacity protein-like surface antigen
MNKQLFTAASAVLATCFLTINAEAGESKSFYVKVGGGIAMPTKKDSTIDQGGPKLSSGDLAPQKLKNGNSIYAGLGYNLADNVRVELEYNEYTGIGRKVFWKSQSPTQKLKARNLLLNAYYDFTNNSQFTPYLGFGVGVSQVETGKLSLRGEVNPNNYSILSPQKKRVHTLAYKLAVGANYKLNETVSFDLGYSFAKLGKFSIFAREDRYDSNTSSFNYAILNNPTKTKVIHAHSLTAGLRVSF